ncbi:MAG: NAD(P)/FAD-dependent oxidoreductase [Candidatus Methanomethylophilaceae archaeon]
MRYDCDVVVVGAGPGGSMAAKHIAMEGFNVILVEKKAEVGAPLRCAEGISKKRLLEVGIEPDPKWISQEIIGSIMRSPSGHVLKVIEVHDGTEIGYVLDRHLFDKAVAEQAAAAGARVMVRTGCTGIITDGNVPVGITANHMGEEIEIYAKCIVAADGFESQVARWAGVDTTLAASDIDMCLQYRMTDVDIEHEFCEFIIGSHAPGGYVWIFPKGERTANVGIGLQASRCEHSDPKAYLDRYIGNDPRLRDGKTIEIVGGGVSTSPGLKESVADNLVIVGDAARVINPLTGGGIYHACLTGKIAGEVISDCLRRGDTSKEALMEYHRRWRASIGDELDRNWRIKEKYVNMSDDLLDEFILAISDYDIQKIRSEDLIEAAREKFPKILE